MGARQWYKVHSAWWTSPSHAHLGATTLGLGLFFVWIADRDPEWRERGSARLMNGDGTPMTIAQIARLGRERRDTVQKCVNDLVSCGTIVALKWHASDREETVKSHASYAQDASESHFITFPNFAKWQQSRSTRALARSNRVSESDGEEKRVDKKRGESDSRRESPPKLDLYGESARRVLAHLSARRQEVVPGARDLAPTKSNLKEIAGRLQEGESEETLMAVVDAAADDARGKPDRHRWLNSTTPFRVSNLARYVALADKPAPPKEHVL